MLAEPPTQIVERAARLEAISLTAMQRVLPIVVTVRTTGLTRLAVVRVSPIDKRRLACGI
jgi:hypothetical protein